MSSGGGKAKTPVLLNDNLKSKQFLRVLDLISEGPIYGPVDTEHMSSIMLNKTPVTNKNGDISINGVAAAWRNGEEDQEPINGFDYLESTVIVSKEVTKETPLVRTITNQEVNRVRLNIGVSSLVKTDSSGNQENSSVQMAIDIKSGSGGYVTQKIVTIGPNKISGEYLEAHIVEAPENKPFDLRVRRITDDSKTDTLQNGTIWNSYTEITDDRLSYPFSAIVGVVIDRDQFKDTPTRNYHYRGIIVDVPDNYDPINRTYDGVWLGGFKKSWTNNPAWLYRALIKSNRYGLAKRVGFVDIDDGRLYSLSQFCDQLVDDGYGGTEPRFTLNAYLTSQEKAKTLLDNIASSLRGSSVWDGSYFSMLIDMPSDPVALITNSNVIDGKFTRNSTPSDERYNAVIVSWVDPDNGWETSKEYVADDISIANDGYKETTIEAFGCTSRGQAHRVGKWLLESSLREPGRISFGMARDAISFMPCDIVEIADNQYIGARVGGRVVSKNKRVVTVDAPLDIKDDILILSMLGANGRPVQFDIDYIEGNKIHLFLEPEYFKEHSPFIVSAKSSKPKLYRITSLKEEENNNRYKISATEHNPNKQAIVDEGAAFEQQKNTINGYRAPSIERLRVISTNSSTVQSTVSWESSTVTKDLSFEVRVYSNDGLVVFEDETGLFSYDFFGLNVGNYFVGIKAKIINGMKGAESQIEMNIGAPPKPTNIQIDSVLFGIKATPYISMDNSINTTFEFWGSEQRISNVVDIETKAKRLGRGSFWIKDGLKEGQEYWFYVRSVNPFGVSDFVEATGKPDNVISDLMDEVGEHFLSTEAGKEMQKDIDFSRDKVDALEIEQQETSQKVIDIDSKTVELDNRVVQINTDVGIANEAILQNTLFTTQLSYKISEEKADRKAEIIELKQVQVTDREAAARWQTQTSAVIASNTSSILAVEEAQATYEEASAKQINQVKADVEGVTGRVTEVESATATLTEAQAKFERSTVAQFEEHMGYITRIETTVSNDLFSLSESVMQTAAQFASQSDKQLKSEARITKNEKAVATETEARAVMGVQIDARLNDTESAITDIKEVQSEQDKALAKTTEQLRAEIKIGDDKLQENIDEKGRELSKVSSSIDEQKIAIAELDKTQTEIKQTQQSQYKDTQASIADLKQTQASDNAVLSESILQNTASINQQGAELTKTNAEVKRISTATANNDKSTAALAESVKTQFEDNASAISRLEQSQSNIESSQAETSMQITAQQNKLNSELLHAKASITETNKVVADNHQAFVQKGVQLDAQFENVNSRLVRVDTAIADNEKALTQTQEQLRAEFKSDFDDTNSLINENKSAIAETNKSIAKVDRDLNARVGKAEGSIGETQKAVADNERALADFSQLTKAEFDNQQAAIEQRAQTVFDHQGNGSAMYKIQAGIHWNGQYHDAKFIIGAEVKNGQVTTQIGFSADTFGILNPSSGKLEPVFFVENGQVFINEAFINQATIEKLLIGSTIKSKHWDPVTKKGLMLDFESGKIIASDAEITGEINATSGTFSNVTIDENCDVKGTIYANKIVGDVIRVHSIPFDGSITLPAEAFDRTLVIPALTVSTMESSDFSNVNWHVEVKINDRIIISFSPLSSVTGSRSAGGDKYDVYAITSGSTSGAGVLYANETATISYKIVGHVSSYKLIHKIPAQCLVFKS
ncbi:phage tail protein [Moellerella wisconsensis]|uniref:TipJ family phage tail tip protein n=1 Tax=Moellerella wisconsensis TaxID=158849 RepID=UPI0025B1B619|nr:phage tail protein [Moellerella wisconsensis]WJW82929.1 phage tail protein [Moellerella wisconsensis]